MSLTIVSAAEVPLDAQRAAFNRAFAGYLAGSMEFDAPGFARFLCLQGADLWHSRLALGADGAPAGFGYLNRTLGIARLAGMGVTPEARRRGVAAALLDHLLAEAQRRGDAVMTLEVFAQNDRARALYEARGFRVRAQLFGWRRSAEPPLPDGGAEMREISLAEAVAGTCARDYPARPWQVSRHLVARMAPGARAFATADSAARIVVTDPSAEDRRFAAWFTADAREDHWPALRGLTAEVLRRFPGQAWRAPAIWPEDFGREVFAPLGFEREALHQLFMRREP